MISAFLAAFLGPIEVIGTKVIYSKERVNWKAFLGLSTVFMFPITVLTFPLWDVSTASNVTPCILGLFLLDILIAVTFNILFCFSLSGEHLADVEPVVMLHPLASMAIAAALFPAERNWPVLFLGFVAVAALVWSRIEKKHLKFSKYLLAAAVFVLLVGVESSIIKVITETIDPLMLYTVRIGLLSTVLLAVLRPNFKVFGKKRTLSIFFVSAVTAVEMLLFFYAISKIGVVKTSLIYLLAPVMVLIGSRFYLGEKIKLKAAIADTIIVICIFLSIIVTR